jgi:hypothetical protein
MIFPSTIQGIPCQIEITWFKPAVPMCITGSGFGDAEPPEPMELEFEVLDQRSREAPWLASKMSQEDKDRIVQECLIMRRGEELADCG